MRGSSYRARPGLPAAAGTETPVKAGCSSRPQESQDAMNGETLHRKVVISNSDGLHMRPATAFAELAKLFQSSVTIVKDGQAFNGKSPLDMMLLAAGPGTELTLEASGPDAPAALRQLHDLLVTLAVVDDADAEPPLPQKG